MLNVTSRSLYRLVFIGLCLVPTIVMTGWAVWAESPLCRELLRRQWRATLAHHLGLPVELQAVVRGPAGAIRLEGLRIVDPEHGATLAAARFVEIERDGRGWVAMISAPRAEQADLLKLVDSIHEHGLRRAAANAPPITWLATDVTLESPRGSTTLSEVHGALELAEAGPRLVLEMTLASGTPGAHARLSITRDRQSSPARSTWRFEAVDHSIPVALLPDVLPDLLLLGDRCEFQGIVEVTSSGSGWSGTVSGQWKQVDLDRWTERLPHKLSGFADIDLRHARLVDGRLVEAEGRLVSRGGVVSRSFLLTTGDERALGMQVAERVHQEQDVLWRYQQLAVDFALSQDGLQLSGRCGGQPPGTLLADSRGPLLQDSPRAVVPAVALVRTLAPASQVLVPAGAETDSLLRHLPLPSLEPPPAVANQPKSTRVRLK